MKESKINIVDLLLAQDASKIRDLPTAQIRITRLSDIIGADFCLEIRALTGAEIESMPDGMEGIDRKILTAVKILILPTRSCAGNLRLMGAAHR